MKRVDRFVTFDGKEHADDERARAHLDHLYGEILCKLSREIVREEKYAKVQAYIEQNLKLFVELDRIRKDALIEKEF